MDEKFTRLFGHYPRHVLERFKAWTQANPDVYDLFKHNARLMRNSGRTKYSASTIVEKIRWDHDIKTKGDVFKINNDFGPIMARLLVYQEPSFDGFFEFRVQANASYVKSHEQRSREDDRD